MHQLVYSLPTEPTGEEQHACLPVQLTTQKAMNEAFAPVPSGPRVIDLVGISHMDQDKLCQTALSQDGSHAR